MHLLLVEDDARLARSLTRLLEEDRHIVEHAPDGRTGIELAAAIDGLDAVILDIGLPDMSGLDVARRIRRDGLDGNTTYHTSAPATVSDVAAGKTVIVRVGGGFRPTAGTNNGSGGIRFGTATDVTVVP